MDLASFKEQYISQLKAVYSHRVICAAYNDIAQRNQALGIITDANMVSDIQGWRTDIEGLETDINALTVTDVFDNFSLEDDDATRFAYVASNLTSCDTAEKQLMCVLALQDIKIQNV